MEQLSYLILWHTPGIRKFCLSNLLCGFFLSRTYLVFFSSAKMGHVTVSSLNYLKQILRWRKIQTADFGRRRNTCQFARSVLSAGFRELPFPGWLQTMTGMRPRKVQSQDFYSVGLLHRSKVCL